VYHTASTRNVGHQVYFLVQNETVYGIRVAKAAGRENDSIALICSRADRFATDESVGGKIAYLISELVMA
jgi:hypothetical protein